MNLEPETARELRTVADALPFGLCRRRPIIGNRVAPRAGVDLDHRRADGDRRLDLARLGGDEQRNADAGVLQPGDHRHERVVLTGHVEAAFRGPLLAPLGYKAGGVRGGLHRDPHHLLGRRHFEVERLCDLGLEARDVVVANVAAVLAQMRGDAVGAGRDRDLRRTHGVRVPTAARVADGRDVIDVGAEAKVGKSRHDLNSVRQSAAIELTARSPCVCDEATRHAFTRSAFATTSFARNCAMIELRCLMSNTSRSMVTEVKSGDERSMLILSMLPSCSAITWATWASEPGSFTVCSAMRAGKRCGVRSSTSQRRSSQRSGASSKSFSAGDWIG